MITSRVDDVQGEIVAALRAAGCEVLIESAHRGHAYDLLVCRAGTVYLMEVKTPGGLITNREAMMRALWPVALVTSAVEALAAVGLVMQ
jgi:hypothetical protein